MALCFFLRAFVFEARERKATFQRAQKRRLKANPNLASSSSLFLSFSSTTVTNTTRIRNQKRAPKETNQPQAISSPISHPPPSSPSAGPPERPDMTIKTLKARILRVLRSSLPAASASPPPSPTKPGRVVVLAADALSDDASFFDAHETPTKVNLPAGPIDDDWELIDQDGDDRDSLASAPAPDVEDLLREFPARCPPGGEEAVLLYTTTLRGIRKTFEDCNEVRALLENLAVPFQERDVSMDRGLREQLWAATGEKAVPPRLFVRGRDIGGAAQVLALHEDGRLVSLLHLPSSPSPPAAASASGNKKKDKCEACGGLRFVVCGECDGSRKVFDGEHGGVRCRGCNENGLVMCTLCYPS